MRKKSHISLAKYLVNEAQIPGLVKHRKAFYLGSILPDCKPSFLTTRHEFNGTFQMVQDRISGLSENIENFRDNKRAYMRHLGEVIHYVADYFTFPHNTTYDGNLKDHCYYEKDLKFRLKEYIRSGEASMVQTEVKGLHSPEDIFKYIQERHTEYLSMKRCVEEDCKYIVSVCYQVVTAVIQLVTEALNVDMGLKKRLCVA